MGADMTEPAMTDDDKQAELYEIRCVGGPFDGYPLTIHHESGFLGVDAETKTCWKYQRDAEGIARPVPDSEGRVARPFDPVRGVDAALGEIYDVISIPGPPAGRKERDDGADA